MDKETIKDSENINSDEWKFLLLMMLMEDIKQKNSQWKSFEDELIYKNRFSVKHAVIDEIHECQANAVTIRKKDTVLYRARVFQKSNFNQLVKYYLQESGYSQSDIEKILNEWTDKQKLLSLIPEIYSDYDYNQTSELVKAQKNGRKISSSRDGARRIPAHHQPTILVAEERIPIIFGTYIYQRIR